MKLRRSTIEKLTFTEIPSLDPIVVLLDDMAEGRGSITICCYGKSWTAYFGAMGEQRIVEFFCRADDDYLAGKLSSINKREIDYDAISAAIGEDVDVTTLMLFVDKVGVQYGSDWRLDLPEKPNPEWTYLRKIVRAVQAGLAEHAPVPSEGGWKN